MLDGIERSGEPEATTLPPALNNNRVRAAASQLATFWRLHFLLRNHADSVVVLQPHGILRFQVDGYTPHQQQQRSSIVGDDLIAGARPQRARPPLPRAPAGRHRRGTPAAQGPPVYTTTSPSMAHSSRSTRRRNGRMAEWQAASAPSYPCLLYTSPSPRDRTRSRMPSSA